ncbi:cytochrome bd-I oxidase subunit CydX [Lamprobacter modestohalophilus]|uniref:cytochrome bd-I oxidase subunit CydX n=1 Tax=Lamprobacter modestohalophilus TaxID=1064514 RepID=UPI003D187C66
MAGAVHPDSEQQRMWYFTWILGVLLAVAFGIINVLWYESSQCLGGAEDDPQEDDLPA